MGEGPGNNFYLLPFKVVRNFFQFWGRQSFFQKCLSPSFDDGHFYNGVQLSVYSEGAGNNVHLASCLVSDAGRDEAAVLLLEGFFCAAQC